MHKNIKLLEIHEVTMNALFIIPVLVPFYRDEIGLDFQDFLFCEAIFAFTVCALEIPSGWISDIWNRKYVLMLSNLFIILGFTALMFANNLPTAIISQIIIGISVSLMSGTNSALLYDTLIASKNEKYFARFEGRRRGFGLYSIAAASFVGGFLYEINRELPIILSICTISIGLIATIFIVEPPRKKKAIQHHPVADMLSTIRYTLVGNTAIGGIIVFSAALFCSTKLIMWMQQPYYIELNIPESMFGVLMAIGFGLGGLASHISHFSNKYISNFVFVCITWSVTIFICIGSAVSLGLHGIVLLMLGGSFIFGASIPRVQDEINKNVGSERRATILSTANLLGEIGFILLSFAVGAGVTQYGVSGGLYVIMAWLILSGGCLFVWSLRIRSPS